MNFRWPQSGAEVLAELLAIVRLGIYVTYCVAIVCLGFRVVRDAKHSPLPLARVALNAGQVIHANDLATPETEALVDHFLRIAREKEEPITPDMVSTDPIAPPIPIGIAIVVRMTEDEQQKGGIIKGSTVRVASGGQDLVEKGTVQDTVCYGHSCSIIIGLTVTPKFDPGALAGARVTAIPPATRGATP